MCDCCICYESIPKGYPRTPCCNQLIHTQCIQQIDKLTGVDYMNKMLVDIKCPWCRSLMYKYRCTRSSNSIQEYLMSCMQAYHTSRDPTTRFMYSWMICKFMKDTINANGYTRYVFPLQIPRHLQFLKQCCLQNSSTFFVDKLSKTQKKLIIENPLWDKSNPGFPCEPNCHIKLLEDGVTYVITPDVPTNQRFITDFFSTPVI